MVYFQRFSCLILIFSTLSYGRDYFYQVEENDQLGVIWFSLGHRKLWTKDSKIDRLKKTSNIGNSKNLFIGSYLKIHEHDIIFKKNVILKDETLILKNKVSTLPQFIFLRKNENLSSEVADKVPSPSVEVIENVGKTLLPPLIETSKNTHNLFKLYAGAGGFMAHNKEVNGGGETKTYTGVQPLLQFKGVYTYFLYGELAANVLIKKIINNQFSFPVNFDYRIQVIPRWSFTNSFNFALSHSVIRHSYVGKNADLKIPYELKSNFIGIGFIVPGDDLQFELYVEKAYKGETRSMTQIQKNKKGLRLDAELTYSLYGKWRFIPGINYYHFKEKVGSYDFSVTEARLVFAREFEF